MTKPDYDLAVVGGGPGGYVAAIRAAQLGLKAVVIEREHLGGICLNWGCIPTKALLRTAEVYDHFHHAKDFGLAVEGVSYDLEAVVKRSRKIAGQLSGGVKHLLKKNKVDVIDGEAALKKTGQGITPELSIKAKNGGPDSLAAKDVILATGARARTLPQIGLEPVGDRIWTYKEAMVPDTIPAKLIVVGSGAIGIEFASFYRSMGAEVTVIEAVDRILPAEDEEISAFMAKQLKARGIIFETGIKIEAVETGEAGVRVRAGNQVWEADRLVSAVGIVGNTETLGLKDHGIAVERGHIAVDSMMRTGIEGVRAIGDVTGAPWLAHKASHEGIVAVEHLAGQPDVHPIDADKIPGCTYCEPQIASIGLTEAQAKAAGHAIRVGRFPFIGNGKAIALGNDQGMTKTIFDKDTGQLLGAHMAGPEVTELIQGFAVAMTCESTEAELMHTVFPHPTLSETMHEATLDAYGRVIHI